MDLDLDRCPDLAALPGDVALFSESGGRLVVTTSEDDVADFSRRFTGLACRRIGTVTRAPRLVARLGGRTVLDADVQELKTAFKSTLSEEKGTVPISAEEIGTVPFSCDAPPPAAEIGTVPFSAFDSLPAGEKARRRADVRVLILTGLGLNCEEETEAAFRTAGASPERVHLLDVLDGRAPRALSDYQVLAFVGGFAFGDHLGAGSVFANKIRWRLYDRLLEFIDRGGLALGICNGFQTMVRLGMLPGFDGDYRTPRTTLAPNDRLGYRDAWIRVVFDPDSPCVWTRGLRAMDLPTRHGEGKFLAADEGVLARLESGRQVAARYAGPDGRPARDWPWNPNGSPGAVAGICDPSGRLFGIMPHPDAFLYAFQHPLWFRNGHQAPSEGEGYPEEGAGIAIFRNGVDAAAAKL